MSGYIFYAQRWFLLIDDDLSIHPLDAITAAQARDEVRRDYGIPKSKQTVDPFPAYTLRKGLRDLRVSFNSNLAQELAIVYQALTGEELTINTLPSLPFVKEA